MIQLHPQNGELHIRVEFGVAYTLGVDLLLGPSIIDKFGRGIFSAKRKLVSWFSQLVDLAGTLTKTQNAATAAYHV